MIKGIKQSEYYQQNSHTASKRPAVSGMYNPEFPLSSGRAGSYCGYDLLERHFINLQELSTMIPSQLTRHCLVTSDPSQPHLRDE